MEESGSVQEQQEHTNFQHLPVGCATAASIASPAGQQQQPQHVSGREDISSLLAWKDTCECGHLRQKSSPASSAGQSLLRVSCSVMRRVSGQGRVVQLAPCNTR